MRFAATSLALLAAITVAPAAAQDRSRMSGPQAAPVTDTIMNAVDTPYPGVMRLEVDATDITRGVYSVKQTIPAADMEAVAGQMTLLYPEWLPGKHAPRGAIAELVDLQITAGGKTVPWVRDSYDVYAFHIQMPEGAEALDLTFKFLTPVRKSEGRVSVTPEMLNLQFEQVSLYPAGYYTRQIKVQPSVILPEGWTGVAALDGAQVSGNRIDYGITDYETLIDSPMFAGKYYRKFDLGNNVTLNVMADEPSSLEAPPAAIAAHTRLVDEAIALFGSRHFDRYEFLLGLTDKLGGIGLEHHRSSENTLDPDYFTDWDNNQHQRGLLPHEIVHSWNGKFRRPEGMWTPDFRTPMVGELLWLYEGQTSYWDLVLLARSGMAPNEMVLGEIARMAGFYSEQAGRRWRSVEDTTLDPIMAARKPKPYASLSRGEDYYAEGSLIWLAADMKIRELTKGKRSLDDFARAFFGIRDGDWGQVTYDFGDVVAELDKVAPYDWEEFLDTRLRQPAQPAPIDGVTWGGYRLVWKDEPNVYDKARYAESGTAGLAHSLGISVTKTGSVSGVMWDSPAHDAGLVNDVEIIAVDGLEYSAKRLEEAITAAKTTGTVNLLTKRGDRYEQLAIAYTGGLRYPHLEKAVNGAAPLDQLLMPLAD